MAAACALAAAPEWLAIELFYDGVHGIAYHILHNERAFLVATVPVQSEHRTARVALSALARIDRDIREREHLDGLSIWHIALTVVSFYAEPSVPSLTQNAADRVATLRELASNRAGREGRVGMVDGARQQADADDEAGTESH